MRNFQCFQKMPLQKQTTQPASVHIQKQKCLLVPRNNAVLCFGPVVLFVSPRPLVMVSRTTRRVSSLTTTIPGISITAFSKRQDLRSRVGLDKVIFNVRFFYNLKICRFQLCPRCPVQISIFLMTGSVRICPLLSHCTFGFVSLGHLQRSSRPVLR